MPYRSLHPQITSLQALTADLKLELTSWREQARAYKRQIKQQQQPVPASTSEAAPGSAALAIDVQSGASQLTVLQRERESLATELHDCKLRLAEAEQLVYELKLKQERAAAEAEVSEEGGMSSMAAALLHDRDAELSQLRAQLRAAGAGASGALAELARCQVWNGVRGKNDESIFPVWQGTALPVKTSFLYTQMMPSKAKYVIRPFSHSFCHTPYFSLSSRSSWQFARRSRPGARRWQPGSKTNPWSCKTRSTMPHTVSRCGLSPIPCSTPPYHPIAIHTRGLWPLSPAPHSLPWSFSPQAAECAAEAARREVDHVRSECESLRGHMEGAQRELYVRLTAQEQRLREAEGEVRGRRRSKGPPEGRGSGGVESPVVLPRVICYCLIPLRCTAPQAEDLRAEMLALREERDDLRRQYEASAGAEERYEAMAVELARRERQDKATRATEQVRRVWTYRRRPLYHFVTFSPCVFIFSFPFPLCPSCFVLKRAVPLLFCPHACCAPPILSSCVQEVRGLQSLLTQRDDELKVKSKGLDLLERQLEALQQQVRA